MKRNNLLRAVLTQVSLVGMLVFMCSVGVRAQIFTVSSGATEIIMSSGNGVVGIGGNVWDAIIVEPNGVLIVQPGAILEFNFMEVQQLGTVTVDRATLDLTGGNGRISLAAGGSANYGSTLEMTGSRIYSSAGIWDGIFVAGWGSSTTLNLQHDRFVAKAKFDDCQITGSVMASATMSSSMPLIPAVALYRQPDAFLSRTV